jgi:hypothetical protein
MCVRVSRSLQRIGGVVGLACRTVRFFTCVGTFHFAAHFPIVFSDFFPCEDFCNSESPLCERTRFLRRSQGWLVAPCSGMCAATSCEKTIQKVNSSSTIAYKKEQHTQHKSRNDKERERQRQQQYAITAPTEAAAATTTTNQNQATTKRERRNNTTR